MHFLLVRNRARSAGPHFHQRLFHLKDDHADHLGRVIGLVEHVIEVGGDDVAGPAENAHKGYSVEKVVVFARTCSRLRGGRALAQAFDLCVKPRAPLGALRGEGLDRRSGAATGMRAIGLARGGD